MSSVVRTVTGMAITRQRDGAGERREVAHAHDQELVDEQTDDDGGRAQQHVVDEADHDAEPRIAPVFGQIGAGEHADRRADENADARVITTLP